MGAERKIWGLGRWEAWVASMEKGCLSRWGLNVLWLGGGTGAFLGSVSGAFFFEAESEIWRIHAGSLGI